MLGAGVALVDTAGGADRSPVKMLLRPTKKVTLCGRHTSGSSTILEPWRRPS